MGLLIRNIRNKKKFNILCYFLLGCLLYPPCIFATNKLVPSAIVQAFLQPYPKAEQEQIEKDYRNIRELCFTQAKQKQKKLIYVATAGAPGSSKSTILESYLHSNPGFVYIDPDQRALRFMINTYLQQTTLLANRNASAHSVLKAAYDKWRGASNYIANEILNEAYTNDLAIAHGTTSSSKEIAKLYKKLKTKGYKIVLLLCVSTKENRLQAIQYLELNQCIVQSAHKDVIDKEKMFYENFPLYFQFADEIKLFWVEDFSGGWIEAGTYTKQKGFKQSHKDFEKLKNAYNLFRNQHNQPLPTLDVLLNNKSSN